MIKQINEQLEVLEKELDRMKSVTEYYKDTNQNSVLILSELKEYHSKYIETVDQLFKLYSDTVEDLKNNTNSIVENEISRLMSIGNQIETSNLKISDEITQVLCKYKETINSTDRLIGSLEALNLKEQFDNQTKQISDEARKVSIQITKFQDDTNSEINTLEIAIMNRVNEQSTELKQLLDSNNTNNLDGLERIKIELIESVNSVQNKLVSLLESDKFELSKIIENQSIKLDKAKTIQYVIGILVIIGIAVQFIK